MHSLKILKQKIQMPEFFQTVNSDVTHQLIPCTRLVAPTARSTSKRRSLYFKPAIFLIRGFMIPPHCSWRRVSRPAEILFVNSALKKTCSGGNTLKCSDRTSEKPGDPRSFVSGENQDEPSEIAQSSQPQGIPDRRSKQHP